MALFGGANHSRGQTKAIVEFKAGKMNLKNNMVTPDKRKGLVYIYQSEDGLTHFCWQDRVSGIVEDDCIVFPEDCIFQKVTQCKEGSRVYLLKFKASSRKLFFWMQEPKLEIDEDIVWKVNEALNNPGSMSSRSQGGNGGSSTPDTDVHNLLTSLNQTQLMQLIGGVNVNDLNSSGLLAQLSQMGTGGSSKSNTSAAANSSSKAPSDVKSSSKKSSANGSSTSSEMHAENKTNSKSSDEKSANSSSAAVQLADLQKILSGIHPAAPSVQVDLAAGVNSEFVKRITSCPETVKKLTPLLPRFGFQEASSEKSPEKEVADTLTSSAFHHALSSFCAAFHSGQLGPLIQQFDFSNEAVQAAKGGNLEAFLNEVQKENAAKGTKEKDSSEKKPEAAEADDMNLD